MADSCGKCEDGYDGGGRFCRNRNCAAGQALWDSWKAGKARKEALPKCALCDEDGFKKGLVGIPCSCARGERARQRKGYAEDKRNEAERARRPNCFACAICGVTCEEAGDLYCIACATAKYGSLENAAELTVMRARRYLPGRGHFNILHPEKPDTPEVPFRPDPDMAASFLARVERLFPGTGLHLAAKRERGTTPKKKRARAPSVEDLRARYRRVRDLSKRARPHRRVRLDAELSRIADLGRKGRS